jgi:hypothetical protein
LEGLIKKSLVRGRGRKARSPKKRLCAYLGKDHGGDLLGRELLVLTEVLDLDLGAAVVIDNLEGPRLDVLLDSRVIETTTNQTPVGVSVRNCL